MQKRLLVKRLLLWLMGLKRSSRNLIDTIGWIMIPVRQNTIARIKYSNLGKPSRILIQDKNW